MIGLDIVRVYKVHKMQTWPPNDAHIQKLNVGWVIGDNTCQGCSEQSLDVKSFHTNTSEWDKPVLKKSFGKPASQCSDKPAHDLALSCNCCVLGPIKCDSQDYLYQHN